MEKIKNNIVFNTANWDYGIRTVSNSFFSLFILIVFLFMADSIAKVAIVISIIICLLIIMDKFIYKVLVVDKDVYVLSYLLRRNRIKPLKVYVKKVEDSNRVYLSYETNKLKLKSVLIFGENSDYVKFYELNKNNFPFSKNFIKEYIS